MVWKLEKKRSERKIGSIYNCKASIETLIERKEERYAGKESSRIQIDELAVEGEEVRFYKQNRID